MAKVGILSMQRIINYGSFLQAYALKTMLEEMGHDVQFVDYHAGSPLIQDVTEKQKSGFARKVNKGLEALQYDAPMSQKIEFIKYKKEFSKKYHKIIGLTEEPNYSPELDTLVIGSDEVFNCVQKNSNVGYSLELFGKNNRAKKVITYAASFGNTTLDKLKKYGKDNEIGSLLEKIDTISVRDENSAEIIRALTDKDVFYNVDPVLAYDYMGRCRAIPKINTKDKYLILYAYSGRISKEESTWIESYAKKKGLKVYAIGGVQKCADRFIDCSPFEVLAYFKGAAEVITDTFHGTIFSVITKRPFVTLIRKSSGNSYGNEEKLTDLLKRLGLENRIVYDMQDIFEKQEQSIPYDVVQNIIDRERKNTIDYLSTQV